MNPWVLLGGVLALLAALATGMKLGSNYQLGKAAREEVLIQTASEAAQKAAAEEIAKIKIVHQTNQTRLEREIVRVPDFSKCRAGDDAKRVLDDALANKAGTVPAGDLLVPGTDPAR